jgi:hypothetical protein
LQWFGWDTLSHLRITEEIAGNFNNFLVCPRDPAGWATFTNILRIPQKFLSRTVADPLSKNLSRGGLLVAYRIEAMK